MSQNWFEKIEKESDKNQILSTYEPFFGFLNTFQIDSPWLDSYLFIKG